MQARDYKLLQENTDSKHIFLPFNGNTVTDILQKPYFVYNSCGPIDESDTDKHPQAFPDLNKDCLFIAEVSKLEEKESLETLPAPTLVQLIKNEWEAKDRYDIEIHRKLITSPSSEKYVQFLIMTDYLTAAKLHPKTFETVRSYKSQIKSGKALYDSIPTLENSVKMVSLHIMSFDFLANKKINFITKKMLFYLKEFFLIPHVKQWTVVVIHKKDLSHN